MEALVAGLILFLGAHSLRIVAPDLRERLVASIGEGPWKGLYSLISAVGLGLIIYGFGAAGTQEPLWQPPVFLRYVTIALMAPSFMLLTAAYLPGNSFRSTVGHPMVAGVKIWALAHLLSNSQPRELLLFGAFLVWSIVAYASLRRRDRAAGVVRPAGSTAGTIATIAASQVGWVLFVVLLHRVLIGVSPLG